LPAFPPFPARYAKAFPAKALDCFPTCNRFTIKDCEEQMKEYSDIFTKTLEKHGIYCVGFASDGDARRANTQLNEMSVHLNTALKDKGFLMYTDTHPSLEFFPRARSDEKDEDGKFKLPPQCLHFQDIKHNLKKLFLLLFSPKMPVLGDYVATLNHVDLVFKECPGEHGLHGNDCHPEDRQSVSTPTRVSGYRVLDSLVRLEQEGKEANLKGTHAVLTMLADYQAVFFSTKLSLEDRIVKASSMMQFLRLWSWAVQEDPKLSLADHFYAQQTFRHVILSLHSMIHLVCATRDYCPEMSMFEALSRCGSDQVGSTQPRSCLRLHSAGRPACCPLTFDWHSADCRPCRLCFLVRPSASRCSACAAGTDGTRPGAVTSPTTCSPPC